MVAVIKTGSSIRRIFHYNEQKVAEGVASCLLAANYPKDTEHLTGAQRLGYLLHQAALNEQVQRNSVHISLNFHPSEQLPEERLREIACAYMTGIGFGEQPFLVYQHRDAGHPHLHLVSVKVRADGSRIDMHNIGRRQSESTRKEIEQRFGLIQAGPVRQAQALAPAITSPRIVQYGRMETKRAIQQVLTSVLSRYHYTSLPELNAVLGLYRVAADRGGEHSRTYRHRGLVYRVLDGEGAKVGVPIKASEFYMRPTLACLERRFARNEAARLPHKHAVRQRVELALRRPVSSPEQLRQVLEKDGMHLVLRQNEAGRIYGMTYVDHRTRCVFNGSALGKGYSAQAVLARCEDNTAAMGLQQPLHRQQARQPPAETGLPVPLTLQHGQAAPLPSAGPGGLTDSLLQAAPAGEYLPHQLKRKKKKKKRLFNRH